MAQPPPLHRPESAVERWLRPLWARLLLMAVVAAWIAVEAFYGETLWLLVAIAAFAQGIWSLFLDKRYRQPRQPPAR